MRTNKNTSKIILATTVALLAMIVSFVMFNNMNSQLTDQQKMISSMQKTKTEGVDNYAYAISTGDLKAGEIVSDEDVDFKQFETINPNAFENRSDVVNKVLLQNITTGSVFTTSHIAKISSDNVSLKAGYRALTLPADNFQGKSDKMQIGSSVDIYSATSDNDWVLENVKIIGFEGKGATTGASNTSTTPAAVGMTNASAITFEVSASTISEFISNISKNKLVLVARNANDKKVLHRTPKRAYSAGLGSYRASSMSSLPNLPASVPIKSFSGGSNLSGLPQPIQPVSQSESVEVIEANVKSKVTFD